MTDLLTNFSIFTVFWTVYYGSVLFLTILLYVYIEELASSVLDNIPLEVFHTSYLSDKCSILIGFFVGIFFLLLFAPLVLFIGFFQYR